MHNDGPLLCEGVKTEITTSPVLMGTGRPKTIPKGFLTWDTSVQERWDNGQPSRTEAVQQHLTHWVCVLRHIRVPSRGGDVMVDVQDINWPSSPTPFCSVLPVSVFMALSFHSMNSPHNSSVFSLWTLRFLTLFFQSYLSPIGPFNYIPFYESLFQPWYNPNWFPGVKAPIN